MSNNWRKTRVGSACRHRAARAKLSVTARLSYNQLLDRPKQHPVLKAQANQLDRGSGGYDLRRSVDTP
jgi:hypothetical protein